MMKPLSNFSNKMSAAVVAPVLVLGSSAAWAAKAGGGAQAESFHDALAQAEHLEELAHHGEAGGGSLPQFDPSTFASQLFWLAVCFIILYLFFSNKTLPEISSVLENRRNHINSDLEAAEELKEKAEEAQAAYEKSLREAKEERANIMHDLEDDIQKAVQKSNAEFLEKSANDINVLEVRLQQSKESAIEDMNLIAAEIASEAAKKIVGIDLDVDNAKSVVAALHKKKAA